MVTKYCEEGVLVLRCLLRWFFRRGCLGMKQGINMAMVTKMVQGRAHRCNPDTCTWSIQQTVAWSCVSWRMSITGHAFSFLSLPIFTGSWLLLNVSWVVYPSLCLLCVSSFQFPAVPPHRGHSWLSCLPRKGPCVCVCFRFSIRTSSPVHQAHSVSSRLRVFPGPYWGDLCLTCHYVWLAPSRTETRQRWVYTLLKSPM